MSDKQKRAFATLTFEVADNAALGETEISLEFTDDVINSASQTIEFEAKNAIIKVHSIISGDSNNDGEVDIKDVVLLSQYLAGWQVDVVPYASDCNKDGTIDIKDIVLLAQYLAGWQIELG